MMQRTYVTEAWAQPVPTVHHVFPPPLRHLPTPTSQPDLNTKLLAFFLGLGLGGVILVVCVMIMAIAAVGPS